MTFGLTHQNESAIKMATPNSLIELKDGGRKTKLCMYFHIIFRVICY